MALRLSGKPGHKVLFLSLGSATMQNMDFTKLKKGEQTILDVCNKIEFKDIDQIEVSIFIDLYYDDGFDF